MKLILTLSLVTFVTLFSKAQLSNADMDYRRNTLRMALKMSPDSVTIHDDSFVLHYGTLKSKLNQEEFWQYCNSLQYCQKFQLEQDELTRKQYEKFSSGTSAW